MRSNLAKSLAANYYQANYLQLTIAHVSMLNAFFIPYVNWAGGKHEKEKTSHSSSIYKACWELKMVLFSVSAMLC